MIALIDSDLVAYRCAATAENDPEVVALFRVDKLMQAIVDETESTEFRAFLSGSNNFRKKLTRTIKQIERM